MSRPRIIHRLLAVAIAVAVPAASCAANGSMEIEFFVLGAILGIAYWYWGPAGTLL